MNTKERKELIKKISLITESDSLTSTKKAIDAFIYALATTVKNAMIGTGKVEVFIDDFLCVPEVYKFTRTTAIEEAIQCYTEIFSNSEPGEDILSPVYEEMYTSRISNKMNKGAQMLTPPSIANFLSKVLINQKNDLIDTGMDMCCGLGALALKAFKESHKKKTITERFLLIDKDPVMCAGAYAQLAINNFHYKAVNNIEVFNIDAILDYDDFCESGYGLVIANSFNKELYKAAC
ncbi:N-6 DNA methylase [Pantoea agglomerans]|uniref:N-6 DNA methylase n=1 Tax=Enterobacter agglomerans TaxID=549 RepID=UPI003C7DE8A5